MVCLCSALLGCGKRNTNLTRANFDKIQSGMTLAEVESLLGGKGEEDPELNLAEGSSVAGAVGIGGDLQSMTQRKSAVKWYRWGGSSRYVQVAFLQDKVAPSNFKKAEGLP
jgi:hypothetical protein